MQNDFTRFYRTRINRSLNEDRSDIASAFQDLIQRHARVSLRLVNYYKGLPINYPATLVEMQHGVLELDVHQQQAVALQGSRYTFIKCDQFQSAILAEVQSSDVRRMTASLRNFVFVDIMAEQRSAVRLELDPPVDGELSYGQLQFSGKVLDVSLGGFSIRLYEQGFPDGAEVKLRLMIPDLVQRTSKALEMEARHVGTSKEADWDICRFRIDPDSQVEGVISRFMLQRQVEIIRELKEATI